MTRTSHKIASLILAAALLVGYLCCFTVALGAEMTGTCGANLTWSLESGVLTISGIGEMQNYSESSPAPWSQHSNLIQSVVVEEGVTAIGNMAFYKCDKLTTVSLSSTVKVIGELSFSDCYELVQIQMPAVEKIGWAGFYNCWELRNIRLPNTLNAIGDKAFFCCQRLGGITIPSSVTIMGNSAFAYCSNLVYVNMQAKLDSLPYWTFYGCKLLWELYLPDSVQKVEDRALSECPNLYFVDYGGSEEVKQEIQKQLDEECTIEQNPTAREEVEYVETNGAQITITTIYPAGSTTYPDTNKYGTTINATITDQTGWSDLVDSINSVLGSGVTPEIIVQVQDKNTIDEGALNAIADNDVAVTIHTSDNVHWEVILQDQTTNSLKGSQNLGVAIVRNQAGSYANLLGDVVTYTISLGENSYNTTVRLPLGKETARQVATLYAMNGKKLAKLCSVIVDDDGMAAFSLAGTTAGQYIIALNVKDIPSDEITIPKSLASQYGIDYDDSTLTDAKGNKYIITGTDNKLGISLGTLTLVVVGVLVGSMIIVGIIMFIWNRQQKKRVIQRD